MLNHVFLFIVLLSSLSLPGKRTFKVGVYVKLHLGADITGFVIFSCIYIFVCASECEEIYHIYTE